MKVLITGGCGFLGSNIADSYLKEGAHVVIIDALFRCGGEENLAWLKTRSRDIGGLAHYRVDLADHKAVDSIFEKHSPFDYICHLGGQVAMTTSLTDPRRDMMTNVVGTFNVLEAMRKHSHEALLAYSSTNKVYGDLNCYTYGETDTRFTLPSHPNGFDEALRLDFSSPYGCSKGAADQYVRDWSRNYNLKTVVFRHSSIYGERQFSTFDQGWIGWFCLQALRQQAARAEGQSIDPFTISGTGKQVRDVLHADDLTALYRAAYQRRSDVAGEILNIGGGFGNSLSLVELFYLLQDLLRLEAPLVFKHTPRRQSDQNVFIADIRKANNVLRWRPKIDYREGIMRMLNWIRSGRRVDKAQDGPTRQNL